MHYCVYYQVTIDRPAGWFVGATMHSFEHLAFERTIDAHAGINEYFVPPKLEALFLECMQGLELLGVVKDIKKLPNRLLEPASKV
ncbi:MAG: hypothetical protein AB7F19_01480 [Candidatus Babeliales bacterium]